MRFLPPWDGRPCFGLRADGAVERRVTTAAMAIDRSGSGARVALSGDLRIGGVEGIYDRLGQVAGPGPVVVDGAGIEAFDTAGAWAIATLRRRLEAEGVEVRIEGLAPERAALLETVEQQPADGRRRRRRRRRGSCAGSASSARGSPRVGKRRRSS